MAAFGRQPLLFARYCGLQDWGVGSDLPREQGWRLEPRFVSHDIARSPGAQMAANSQRRRRLSGEGTSGAKGACRQQGGTEAYLGAYLGFAERMLFLLAQAGLITIRHEIINTGAELIDIGRVGITDAGRRALEDATPRKASPRLNPDE
jgi:hypothetical protein